MDSIAPSDLPIIGGFALLVALFVVREIASGALKEAGRELWVWVRGRR